MGVGSGGNTQCKGPGFTGLCIAGSSEVREIIACVWMGGGEKGPRRAL